MEIFKCESAWMQSLGVLSLQEVTIWSGLVGVSILSSLLSSFFVTILFTKWVIFDTRGGHQLHREFQLCIRVDTNLGGASRGWF